VFLDVTTLAQRRRVRNFGCAAIGKPNFMVSIPPLQDVAASLTSATRADEQMPFLRTGKNSLHGRAVSAFENRELFFSDNPHAASP
jgi:hypothetical protein